VDEDASLTVAEEEEPPRHPINESNIATIISLLRITYLPIKDSKSIYLNNSLFRLNY
jgi:hypothetical protein